MKKTALTTVIFFTFFSGSPKETNIPKPRLYSPEKQEVIIKLQELNSIIENANKLLYEKGI